MEIYTETLSFTYVDSRFTCINWVFPIHFILSYVVFLIGIAALASRVWPALKPWHARIGQSFLICMYWLFGTGVLISNDGTPASVIGCFAVMLAALSLGYPAIGVYKKHMHEQILKSGSVGDLQTYEEERNRQLAMRTFSQRLFSLKALHGSCMALAWLQIAARIVTTWPWPFHLHDCWTYPAAKGQVNGSVNYLPSIETSYPFDGQQMVFFFANQALCVALIVVVGLSGTWFWHRRRESSVKYLKVELQPLGTQFDREAEPEPKE